MVKYACKEPQFGKFSSIGDVVIVRFTTSPIELQGVPFLHLGCPRLNLHFFSAPQCFALLMPRLQQHCSAAYTLWQETKPEQPYAKKGQRFTTPSFYLTVKKSS